MTLEEIFEKRFGKRWRKEVASYMNWSYAKVCYVVKNPSKHITFDDATLIHLFTGVNINDLYAAIYTKQKRKAIKTK